jgi:hypothetical protein
MLSSFKAFCRRDFISLALPMFGVAASPGRDRKFMLHFILTFYNHPLLASNFTVKPLSTFFGISFLKNCLGSNNLYSYSLLEKFLSENWKNFLFFCL